MKEYYIKSKQTFLFWTEEYKDKMNYGIKEWMKDEDQFLKNVEQLYVPHMLEEENIKRGTCVGVCSLLLLSLLENCNSRKL